jgi:hypothetical protein
MHHNITHALDDYNKAKACLHDVMCNMSLRDLEEALNNAGYSGTNTRPVAARYMHVNKDGHYVYYCEWADDGSYNDNDDTGVVDGNLYVQVKNGKIIADW